MYEDAQTQLWAAAALTASAVSTNAYDLGTAPTTVSANGSVRDPSTGEQLVFVIAVGVAADHTTGDETYEFDVISATANDLTTGQLIIAKYVILFSALTAGAIIVLSLPPLQAGTVIQRFLGLKYVGGGTTPTITVTAWITMSKMVQAQAYYPTAIVVN
jgi:hypothetical protein